PLQERRVGRRPVTLPDRCGRTAHGVARVTTSGQNSAQNIVIAPLCARTNAACSACTDVAERLARYSTIARFAREANGGEAGIRTLGTGFSPYNGLANRRLQPLGHLTAARLLSIRRRSGYGGNPNLVPIVPEIVPDTSASDGVAGRLLRLLAG